jgi:hypothetical protein
MAKRRKVLPARGQREARDVKLRLLRSAESLGRMIGALQRQLEAATKAASQTARVKGKKKKKKRIV